MNRVVADPNVDVSALRCGDFADEVLALGRKRFRGILLTSPRELLRTREERRSEPTG